MKLNDHKQVESSNKINLVTVYYHAGIMEGSDTYDCLIYIYLSSNDS